MQCTAIAPSTGKQCRKTAQDGTTKCHLHGAKAPNDWEIHHLPEPAFKKNEKKLNTRVRKLVAAQKLALRNNSDPNLCIYVFQIAGERHFYKIGMTTRGYVARLKK